MEQAKLEDFVTNAALLAAHLVQQCDRAVAEQQAATQDLRGSADLVGRNVAEGNAELARSARTAVREALAKEIPSASRSLGESADRLKRLVEGMEAAQQSAGTRMRTLGWTAIMSLLLAAAVIIGGTTYIASRNIERADQAQVRENVLKALEHVTITSCDGRPCVKLEQGLQRWTKNDEYVLVDTDATGD